MIKATFNYHILLEGNNNFQIEGYENTPNGQIQIVDFNSSITDLIGELKSLKEAFINEGFSMFFIEEDEKHSESMLDELTQHGFQKFVEDAITYYAAHLYDIH